MRIQNLLLALGLGLVLVACGDSESPATETVVEAVDPLGDMTDSERLAAVLASQPEDIKARYQWRHPQETLEFFGIKPGMTVVEILPGGGWYTRILLPYLGRDGQLIGADYPMDIWPNFSFATPEFIEKRRGWVETWPGQAAAWQGDFGASVQASRIGEFPESLEASVDAVLFIRALHNLKRFQGEGEFLSRALEDTMRLLKPGGIIGVVQHRAPDERDDVWADGSRGYLKKIDVISIFEDAGFQLVEQSNVNANPEDVPGEDDIVWRLPPSLNTSKDDPELRAQYEAIGESNRMTLLFRKSVY